MVSESGSLADNKREGRLRLWSALVNMVKSDDVEPMLLGLAEFLGVTLVHLTFRVCCLFVCSKGISMRKDFQPSKKWPQSDNREK
jgi:hypothetical protein